MAEIPMTTAETAPDAVVQRYRPAQPETAGVPKPVAEIGGRKDGSDPTRFGDWEKNGRCIDF